MQCLTNELREANQALSRRAVHLETSSQVGRQATSILDLGELLTDVTELIRAEFDYYFVGVWLWYESKDGLALQASAGETGHLLEQAHVFSPDVDKNIITQVNQTTTPYIIDDVARDPLYEPLAELTETQAQLALPLRVGDERIGVLDIRSAEPAAFDNDDQKVLQTLANQIAIAIRNARLYEMEKRINADKDKFFSIISHDLRGPFTSLLGNAQMMLNMADDLCADDIRHMSGAIFNGAKAALSLLDNLMTWSRIQRQGEMDFCPQALTLKPVAQETLELLTPAADDKNIALKNAVDDTLTAYADRNMVDTVIRNLTSNALKFTPRGGSVTIVAAPHSLNGRETKQVRISVEDTGVGMKQQDLNNLFRLESNFTTLGTEQEQGSGLGLIICKEMVERNGGRIWMESEAGKGTKAQFTLPLPDDYA